MKKKQSKMNASMTFKKIQKAAPDYPDITCPQINDILDKMERVRDSNANLRDGLQFWRSHCRELLKLLTDEQRKEYLKNNPIF